MRELHAWETGHHVTGVLPLPGTSNPIADASSDHRFPDSQRNRPHAHAKNYSLILDPASGIRLSPQYDAVATRHWPEFNWELTMPLNEDHAFAEHTTPQDWEDLATCHGLDGPRVADMARRMAGKVLAGISESCEGLDSRMADRLNTCWMKANESIEPIMPGDESANSLDPTSALSDLLRFPSSGRIL